MRGALNTKKSQSKKRMVDEYAEYAGYSSSGDSTVVLVDGTRVTQTFRHPLVCSTVREIALKLAASAPVNIRFSDGTTYVYTPLDFHSQLLSSSDTTVTWERIHCLNQMDIPSRMRLVRTHFIKFLWDIVKGIFALASCGIRHGDPSLDNIGTRQGHFVLFDYNLSRKVPQERSSEALHRDLYQFSRSIRWNIAQYDPTNPLTRAESDLLDVLPQVRHLEEFVETVMYALDANLDNTAGMYTPVLRYLDTLDIDSFKTNTIR
jgi:hypothetical protein